MKINRPLTVYLLIALMVFTGLGGLGGGMAFLHDPTGSTMGLSLALLAGSPFHSYLVPGLFLLLILGLGPLAIAVALWQGHPRAWDASLAMGATLRLWISIETSIIGLGSWMQPFFFLVGAAMMGLTVAPASRRYTNA
ncbi:MAG: hypothetical protein ACFB51_02915 [Anaerolineae bacterium]